MATKSYTYNPALIGTAGIDRMRFELGDTQVEGAADTAALSNEEISAMLAAYPDKWKRAKLALLESLSRRFSFEVDTDVGPLTLGLQARSKAWREMYKELSAELKNSSLGSVTTDGSNGQNTPPYFYAGMLGTAGTNGGSEAD